MGRCTCILTLLTLYVCATVHTEALNVRDSINRVQSKNFRPGIGVKLPLFDYYAGKFAYGDNGTFKINISALVVYNEPVPTPSASPSPVATATQTSSIPFPSCFGAIIFCDVTKYILRDSSYQMKLLFAPPNADSFAISAACNPGAEVVRNADLTCSKVAVKYGSDQIDYRIPKQLKRKIVAMSLVACRDCIVQQNDTWRSVARFKSNHSAQMLNEGTPFRHLGWDEAAYPISSIVIASLAGAIAIILAVGAVMAFVSIRYIPFVFKITIIATLAKILSSSVTAAAMWSYALTGNMSRWYFGLRVPLIIVDELLVGLLMLVMSTGLGMMPPTWMFDRRSSTFAIFLGTLYHMCHVASIREKSYDRCVGSNVV